MGSVIREFVKSSYPVKIRIGNTWDYLSNEMALKSAIKRRQSPFWTLTPFAHPDIVELHLKRLIGHVTHRTERDFDRSRLHCG